LGFILPKKLISIDLDTALRPNLGLFSYSGFGIPDFVPPKDPEGINEASRAEELYRIRMLRSQADFKPGTED